MKQIHKHMKKYKIDKNKPFNDPEKIGYNFYRLKKNINNYIIISKIII